jgi:hypothetical protein
MIARYYNRIRMFTGMVARRCLRGQKPAIRDSWAVACMLRDYDEEIDRIHKKYKEWQIWTRR